MPGPTNETICSVTVKFVPPAVALKSSVVRATASRRPAIFDCFAGNDPRIGNNVEVAGFSAKFRIPFGATTEHIFAADSKIGLIVDERINGGSAPEGTRDGIGEFGEDSFERR